MTQESPPNLNKEIKLLVADLRKTLPYVRNILFAPFAFGIAIAEKYAKESSEKQVKAKEQLRKIEEEKILEERAAQEKAKIAEELRAEEREKRLIEEERKLTPKKLIYPVFSAISSIALVIGVVRLAPIAKWTMNVNRCIEEISKTNELEDLTPGEKVMLCNRGRK